MPRREVMQYMCEERSLALITFRHTRNRTPMRAFVSRTLIDAHLLSSEANCYVLPLLLSAPRVTPDGQVVADISSVNFDPKLLPNLSEQYGVCVNPEEVFNYISLQRHLTHGLSTCLCVM